jgi:hypothetical protein
VQTIRRSAIGRSAMQSEKSKGEVQSIRRSATERSAMQSEESTERSAINQKNQ